MKMNATKIQDRFANLYKLRNQLCKEQQSKMELDEIKKWITDQLEYLRTLAKNKNVDRSEICIRIDDVLCALDVEEDDHE
jgi:hypothetical protein